MVPSHSNSLSRIVLGILLLLSRKRSLFSTYNMAGCTMCPSLLPLIKHVGCSGVEALFWRRAPGYWMTYRRWWTCHPAFKSSKMRRCHCPPSSPSFPTTATLTCRALLLLPTQLIHPKPHPSRPSFAGYVVIRPLSNCVLPHLCKWQTHHDLWLLLRV